MHSWYPQYWLGGQEIMELESEGIYRQRIQKVFNQIETAFENIDPDIAECEQSMGALTLTFADRSRLILSAQPSVRQLWLALAAQGTAYHFNFDSRAERWTDDKGKGIELIQFLENYLTETTKLPIRF